MPRTCFGYWNKPAETAATRRPRADALRNRERLMAASLARGSHGGKFDNRSVVTQLAKLRADGYGLSPDYAGADVVLVNTCGFLDSAKEESLEAKGEPIAENGRVIVTGTPADVLEHPDIAAVGHERLVALGQGRDHPRTVA